MGRFLHSEYSMDLPDISQWFPEIPRFARNDIRFSVIPNAVRDLLDTSQ